MIASDGQVTIWETTAIRMALAAGLVPVIYGDVTFDEVRGGTILSTEDLFGFLARALNPERILLAGLEEAVFIVGWLGAEIEHHVRARYSQLKLRFVPMHEVFGRYKDIVRRVPDLGKAEALLGYKPRHTMEEAIRKTLASIARDERGA